MTGGAAPGRTQTVRERKRSRLSDLGSVATPALLHLRISDTFHFFRRRSADRSHGSSAATGMCRSGLSEVNGPWFAERLTGFTGR
ncbi:hypothetical protein ABH917_004131 [Thermobifida halotolerans]